LSYARVTGNRSADLPHLRYRLRPMRIAGRVTFRRAGVDTSQDSN